VPAAAFRAEDGLEHVKVFDSGVAFKVREGDTVITRQFLRERHGSTGGCPTGGPLSASKSFALMSPYGR